MTDIVLVHGGAHGAWCWARMVPLLEADDRIDRVVAVDLPGRDAATSDRPLDEITVDDFVDHLVAEVERHDLGDIVLVGHSLAGVSLTPAAHRLAPRLRRLVYLSTVNPAEGESVMDVMAHPASPLSRGLSGPDMFCTDFTPAEREWLTSRLGDEAILPMVEPVTIPRPPAGVPATYILLERDEALAPELQHRHITNLGIDEVVTMDAGHSPFVTHPAELAAILLDFA